MRQIVLASASPRRAELLRQLGLSFIVDPSLDEEHGRAGEPPGELVARLSLAKARTVALRHPDALIIAADTIGLLEGDVLGKAATPVEARAMLAALNGITHSVISGVTVLDAKTGKADTRTVETRVSFKKLIESQIAAYVAGREWVDKAGAYAIQGRGAAMIDCIAGDYSNVVGLPLGTLADMLAGFGISVL